MAWWTFGFGKKRDVPDDVPEGAGGWDIAATTVRGFGHVREGIENQDHVDATTADDGGFLAVAVADGHGDVTHLRSAFGAQVAVRSALDHLLAHRDRLREAVAEDRAALCQDVFAEVLAAWRRDVDEDLAARPLAVEEFVARGLSPEDAAAKVESAGAGRKAYGTTLVAAAVWQDGGVAWRLGDGAGVIVPAADDQPVRSIFATDDSPSADGEATQSMCGADPESHVEVVVLDVAHSAFVAVVTDGYYKSFGSVADFGDNVRWVWQQLRREGADRFVAWLEDVLNQISRDGSEDDISFAAVWRQERDATLREPPAPAAIEPEPPT